MKILITGANGYIGRHVVQYLLNNTEHTIVAVGKKNISFDNKRVTYIQRDIFEEGLDVYNEFQRPDTVIHLAWENGFNHQDPIHIKNLPKHFLFLKKLIDSGIISINVIGTMHEVGYHIGKVSEDTRCEPRSLYGISKNALKQSIFAYAHNKKINIKWLRAYYIVGDDLHNNSIFTHILNSAKQGKKLFPFTQGNNKYDFINIYELAKQISLSSLQNNINGIIEVCSGQPISLKEKVNLFIKENNLNLELDYGAFPERPYDSPEIYGDNAKIKSILENYTE